MKTLISMIATLAIVSIASAQTVGTIELDDAGAYGQKKLRKGYTSLNSGYSIKCSTRTSNKPGKG